MKNFEDKILGSLKKLFGKIGDRDPRQKSIHPYRDWWVLLGLFCAAFILSALAHFLIFISLNSQEPVPSEEARRTIREKELREVLKTYGEKEALFNTYLKEAPQIRDPR